MKELSKALIFRYGFRSPENYPNKLLANKTKQFKIN